MRAFKTMAFVLSAAVAVPTFAFAQDDEAETEEVDPLAPTDGAATEEAADDGADASEEMADDDAPFARIADQEETIYAVQRKAFLVDGKFELTPLLAASFTDRFVQTFAPAGSVTYHVAENFGIELFGGYMFPTESGLTREILQKGKLTPETAKLTQMLWAAGLGVQWSPIYGKVQLFGASLGNFNFYVGAGVGVGQTRVRCTPGTALDPVAFPNEECPAAPPLMGDQFEEVYEPASLQVMGSLSGGVRFYFSNWLGLKFEIKDYLFSARVYRPETQEATQRFTDAIRSNVYAQLGVSFLLGGEDN
ncbi:MAG: outer membrane beta-barrel domain-containing protein [Deltaproteobacteria bacterium]